MDAPVPSEMAAEVEDLARRIGNVCRPWVNLRGPLTVPPGLVKKVSIFAYLRACWQTAEDLKERILSPSDFFPPPTSEDFGLVCAKLRFIEAEALRHERRMTRRKSAPVLKEVVRKHREALELERRLLPERMNGDRRET